MTVVIKPPPLRPAVEGGYTLDDFAIDQNTATVTCPARHHRADHRPSPRPLRPPLRHLPVTAPLHHRRPGAGHRPAPPPRLLAAARALATTDTFYDTYRQHRPMVERSIAWLLRGANRRLRYRGTARNRLWLAHCVAAVNLQRFVNLGLTHRAKSWAST